MLTIGIASYKNPDKLRATIASIQRQTVGDYRILIVHNPADGDESTREVICGAAARDDRIEPIWMEQNDGYAGAVNRILSEASGDYVAYCDNDIEIKTHGWNAQFAGLLDRHHEIGMVFPNGGPFPIDRGAYTEILWGGGHCWMLNRLAIKDIRYHPSDQGCDGFFDGRIGHQEEADFAIRLRLAGWRLAAIPSVNVLHHCSATNSPESQMRINEGVRNWVTKWNRYFNGNRFDYHSAQVTRIDDWPCCALHIEEYWQRMFPGVNSTGWQPEKPEFQIGGFDYEWLRVPRRKSFYTGRVI
jgi:GT2 family glycosyltransferase